MDETNRALHDCMSHLSADCTALGLIVDEKGNDPGQTIEKYYAISGRMQEIHKSPSEWENEFLNLGIEAIRLEIKRL